jgi:hypothetical protein
VPPVESTIRNSNLVICADCGKEISIHAESCPHCGAMLVKKKHHGVFFYVFWSVLSLIGTVMILFVGSLFLSGVFSGVRQAVRESKATAPTPTPRQPPLTAAQMDNARAILGKLDLSKDEVRGTTWLRPSWAAEGYENDLYLYIGIDEAKEAWLRLKIRHKGTSMLNIREFVFRIDDAVKTIEPEGPLKTDYVVENFWEWLDEPAERHMDLLEKMAKAHKVLYRCQGRQDYDDRTLTDLEMAGLQDMLLVYRYLKENPQPR